MDSITGIQGGATKLSFAQKVIASGLSVVLAVGLSPIGQAPTQAYAAEQTAQSEVEAQAYKEASWNVSNVAESSTSLEYDGAAQTYAFTVQYTAQGSRTPTILQYGVDYTLNTVSKKNIGEADSKYAAFEGYTVSTSGANKQVTELAITDGAAGVYQFSLVGMGEYADLYETTATALTFTITPLDISDAALTAPNAKSYTYNGKDQNVELGTIVATVGTGNNAKSVNLTAADYYIDEATQTVKNPTDGKVTAGTATTGNITVHTLASGNIEKATTGTIVLPVAKASFSSAKLELNKLSSSSASFDPIKAVTIGDDSFSYAASGTAAGYGDSLTVSYYGADGSKLAEQPKKVGTYTVKASVIPGSALAAYFDVEAGNELSADYEITENASDTFKAADIDTMVAAGATYVPANSGMAATITYKSKDGETIKIPDGYSVTTTYSYVDTKTKKTVTLDGAPTNANGAGTIGDKYTVKSVITSKTDVDDTKTVTCDYVIDKLEAKAATFKVTQPAAKDMISEYTGAEVNKAVTSVQYAKVATSGTTYTAADPYVVIYTKDAVESYNGVANAGKYAVSVQFGELTTDKDGKTVVKANENYKNDGKYADALTGYEITSYSIATASLALAGSTYNGQEQPADLYTNDAFAKSKAAALQTSVLSLKDNEGTLTATYKSADGVEGTPKDAGTYYVTVKGTKNYADTVQGSYTYKIDALASLSGYALQFQDPDTNEWVAADSGLRIAQPQTTGATAKSLGWRVVSTSDSDIVLDNGTISAIGTAGAKADGSNGNFSVAVAGAGTAKAVTLTSKGSNLASGLTAEGSYEVAELDMNEAASVNLTASSATYSGKNQPPKFTVADSTDATKVISTDNYDVVYAKVKKTGEGTAATYEVLATSDKADGFFTDAGTYQVWAVGKGQYAGTAVSDDYTIDQYNVADADKTPKVVSELTKKGVEVLQAAEMTYNGEKQTWAPEVYFDGTKLAAGTDYVITGNVETNAGTYTPVIHFVGSDATKTDYKKFNGTNFTGTWNATVTKTEGETSTTAGAFVIKQAKQTLTVTSPVTVAAGATVALKAASDYKDATIAYTFPAGDAVIDSIDSEGNLKAKTGAFGTTTVTVTATDKKTTGVENYEPATKTIIVAVMASQEMTVAIDKAEIAYGETAQVTVNDAVGDVSYKSDDEKVATVKDGVVTATGVGTAEITVTASGSNIYGPASKSVTVKVVKADNTIKAAKDLAVDFEGTATIEATDPAGAVSYTSADPTAVTVDENGVVTGLKAGAKVAVTAHAAGDENHKAGDAVVNVTVGKQQQTLTGADVETTYGLVGAMVAAPTSSVEGVEQTYKYELAEPSDVIEVAENGLITILKAGEAKVKISTEGTDAVAPAETTVTVKVNKADQEVKANDVTVAVDDDAEITGFEGIGEMSLVPAETDKYEVDSTDNTVIGVHVGEAELIVKAAGDENHNEGQVTVKVTVTKGEQDIDVDDAISMAYGDSQNLDAEAEGELKYLSIDDSIATVDAEGNVTATGVGIAYIMVSAEATEDYEEADPEVVKVTVVKAANNVQATESVEVEAGKYAQIQSDGVGAVTYKSSDLNVCTVDDQGNVLGLGAGSAIITVTYAGDANYAAGSAAVSVKVTGSVTPEKVDQEVVATAAATTLPSGATTKITVSKAVGDVTYTSSDDRIVSVDANGNVTADFPGFADIVVTAAGDDTTNAGATVVRLTVVKAENAIVVTPATVTVEAGQTTKLIASGVGTVTYASDNTAVAGVAGDGTITALAAGEAKVTVTAAGNERVNAGTATVTVTVTAAPEPTPVPVENPDFKVKAKKIKAKANKKTKVKAAKAFKVTNAEGAEAPTFKKTSGTKYIKVKKGGKVIVKGKKLKAGKTYKVKVTATSAANDKYLEATQNVVLKVKIKKK